MRVSAALLPVVLAAGALAQQPAPAPSSIDPAKRAAIEEVLALSKADQMIPQMLTQVEQIIKPQIEQSLPPEIQNSSRRAEITADLEEFENRLWTIIRNRMDFAKMKPDMVKLYDETFTTEELNGIAGFYKSPAGQALLQKLPILTAKSVEFGTKLMNGSMEEIRDMTLAWSEEMKKKYAGTDAK